MADNVEIKMSLPAASLKRLEDLQEVTKQTKEQVFGNAVQLYEDVVKKAEEGCTFLVRDKDGNLHDFKIFG